MVTSGWLKITCLSLSFHCPLPPPPAPRPDWAVALLTLTLTYVFTSEPHTVNLQPARVPIPRQAPLHLLTPCTSRIFQRGERRAQNAASLCPLFPSVASLSNQQRASARHTLPTCYSFQEILRSRLGIPDWAVVEGAQWIQIS